MLRPSLQMSQESGFKILQKRKKKSKTIFMQQLVHGCMIRACGDALNCASQ
jgi:hypothetical protein